MVFLVDQASHQPTRNFQSLAVDHHPPGNLFYFSECQKCESQLRGEALLCPPLYTVLVVVCYVYSSIAITSERVINSSVTCLSIMLQL